MSPEPVFRPQFRPHTDPQSPAPFRFEGVTFRVFPLRAEAAPLQALCDRQLNEPAQALGYPGRWRPLAGEHGGAIVYLEVVSYRKIFSTAPGYGEMGYASQDELVFLVPLVELDSAGSPTGLSSFVPYCAVDDDWSLITGRQVLGYPKVRGRFQLPDEPTDVGPLRVEVTALRQYSADSRCQSLPVVEVVPIEPPPPPPGVIGEARDLWPLGPVDEIYGSKGIQLAPDLRKLLGPYVGVKIPGVALKQARAVPGSTGACFQGLAGFDIALLKNHDAGMLPVVPVELHDYASLPLRAALGLPATGPLEPIFPFWYLADLELDNARSLADSSAGSSTSKSPSDSGQCWEVLRKAGALYAGEVEAQASQWRQAADKMTRGGYGPAEAGQDLQEAYRRNLTLSTELGRLWWDGWRQCGQELSRGWPVAGGWTPG